MPQIVFSRLIFGYRGAYLAGALTLFPTVGWFAVDCVIATNAPVQLLGQFGVEKLRETTARRRAQRQLEVIEGETAAAREPEYNADDPNLMWEEVPEDEQ